MDSINKISQCAAREDVSGKKAHDANRADREKKELLQIVYGDFTLGIRGNHDGKSFSYIFNFARGGMESMVINGMEWLYRIPRPTFWRALTDNDRGNRFHLSSGMWLAADTFIKNTDTRVSVDGRKLECLGAPANNCFKGNETAESAEVEIDFETVTVPAAKVTVRYSVSADGGIGIKARYFGREGLPELPVFGMRFLMPTAADSFFYEGLSGETYPDRMAGGVKGIYEVKGLPVTPYLVPQDCGMHMDTEWVKVFRTTVLDNRNAAQPTYLKFETVGQKFAFSCLPYTAEELENALHIEELPPVRRTVLCIYGAVRGVGGIDSWGSQPESPYHVSAEKDHELEFRICMD